MSEFALYIGITSHDIGDDLKCSHTMICFTYSVYQRQQNNNTRGP